MKKIIITSFLSLMIILGLSCKKENKNQQQTTADTVVNKQELNKTFYLVPSPEDIFGFADEKSLKYVPELINPESNLSKYIDVKYQEFNFGVYAADLAYCAANSKNDETTKYLNIVRKLSQSIGLSDVFNESLIYRIEHVAPVKDSLIAISNDTYFDILRYLENNERDATLSIMACGGWIESIYLVINQTKYSKNSKVIQKIADQKYIVTNLWKLLEQNQQDKNVLFIKNEFEKIYKIYEKLEIKIDEKTPTTAPNEKVIIVGGNLKVEISDKEYEEIKKYINEVRNNLTLNNVSN